MDPDDPGLQPSGDPVGGGDVAGLQPDGHALDGADGQLDGLVLGVAGRDGEHRTEHLLLQDAGVVEQVSDDGELVEDAGRPGDGLSSGHVSQS